MRERARPRRPVGPGRVLALGYGFFTLAAGARSAVQLSDHPHRALTAYVLSAVSAAVYLSGTVLVAQADLGRWRRTAVGVCLAEVLGVATVGSLSVTRPDLFPDASVWSGFGSGYGYVPAVLPLVALLWLHGLGGRNDSRTAAVTAASAHDHRVDPDP